MVVSRKGEIGKQERKEKKEKIDATPSPNRDTMLAVGCRGRRKWVH